MALLTLAEARTSRLREVAQTCSNSAEFLSLLNEATQALMTRGDWVGLVVPIFVCVKGGCVTWPRYVEKVRRLNRCGSEVRIGNLWWEFVDRISWGCDGLPGMLGGLPNYRMVNRGRYPTYSDVANADRYIRAYPLCQADVGKTIQIFGVDGNGQPLMTQNGSSWTEGVTITLAIPYGTTSTFVRRIDRVIKDITQKNVQLFAYDPVNAVLEDLAVYEPTETLPNYERDEVFIGGVCCNSSTKSITALVKLRYIPIVADTDLVLISNIRALKFAIQAIKLEEAGQDVAADAKMAKAVKELNLELEDEYPRDQTPVDSGFMGGSMIGEQHFI